MDRAEAITRNSVRDRAQRYSKAPDRLARVWDDTADAVPIGKKRSSAPTRAPTAETRTSRAGNPYRVRDSMARAGKKSTVQGIPCTGTSPPRADTAAASDAPRVKPRNTVPGGAQTAAKSAATSAERRKRAPGYGTEKEIPQRVEEILNEDTMSDSERVVTYRRAVRRKLLVRLRRIGAACLIASIFLVGALFLVYKLFYVIDDITLTGASLYPPETILEATGVSEGANLYSFSSRKVQNRVTLQYPYVRSLTVDREAPNTVHFTVTEDQAVFCAYIYGELRALSPTLRVLDRISEEHASEQGLIRLCLPAVDEAIAGRVLTLENERSARMIRDVASTVLSSALAERITAIDLTESHTLRMVCDGQYLLHFGDTQNVGTKLKIASAVMEDSLFSTAVKAQIDLTSLDETSVVLDDQLDLNW